MNALFILIALLYLAGMVFYFAFLFRQTRPFHRWGTWMVTAGFIGHCAYVIMAFWQTGQIPVRNLHDTLMVAGWAVSGVFLFFQYRSRLKVLGVYATPLMLLIMIFAAQVPQVGAKMSQTPLNNLWILLHVIVLFIGEAAFAMACGAGILYLIQEHAIKSKRHGFFYKRLPSLELLDSTGYTCLITGFTLMTIGLIAGFAYARFTWGRFWSWDPKEVWSGITWLFYAVLLHERVVLGWRGKKAAIMAIVGFAVLLFTFIGVNFLMQGHHVEFTRW